MKIATITYHGVNNYGAVLQAYALQQTIIKLGYQTEIINYSRENIKDVLYWQKNKILNLLKGKKDRQLSTNEEFINMIITAKKFNTPLVKKKFEEFRKQLKLSEHVTKKNVHKLNDKYDLIITGSDQVWNCGRINMEKTYFLDFVTDNNKKGSYAASFGITEIPGKYLEDYKRLISQFKYIAVREQAGADIVRKIINREAKVVLDPTFLLSAAEWEKILPAYKVAEKFIVVYQLGYSTELMKFARELSKKTGYKIVMLNRGENNGLEEYREDVGPIEWLEAVRNAEYIVTNSFHGIAFSINFNKQFYVEVTNEKIRSAMGSRINNVLNIFGLEMRLIIKGEHKNIENIINYNEVNNKLNILKEDSLYYLKNMLSNLI